MMEQGLLPYGYDQRVMRPMLRECEFQDIVLSIDRMIWAAGHMGISAAEAASNLRALGLALGPLEPVLRAEEYRRALDVHPLIRPFVRWWRATRRLARRSPGNRDEGVR